MEDEAAEHRPICLTFSHGNLSQEAAANLRCEMLTKITQPNRVSKVIVRDTSDNHFVGDVTDSNLCENFIIIRNKKTKTMRLYPVDHVFMHPYRSQELQRSVAQTESKSARESLNYLHKVMGSKKIKRKLLSMEKNAANLPNLEESFQQAIKSNDSAINADLEPNQERTYLPPCNRNATSVESVFKIEDMVSLKILNSLDTIAEEVMQMDLISWAAETRFSPFMIKAVLHVPKDALKFKLLLFVDRLLALLKQPRLLSKSHEYCSFSTAVNAKLIEDFTVPAAGGKRRKTDEMNDKILCHSLVLIMICCNYEIDIGLLAGIVTPAQHKRLPSLLRLLGAKSVRSTPSIYKLNVPVTNQSNVKRPSMKGKSQ